MRKKQTPERDFELIKDGKFNSDYPRSYNLALGYSYPSTSTETRSYKPNIIIVE